MDKCLVFEVKGDWAHFRKIYTTSSPLSYSIPPRTAIVGLIAAIIGLDKEQYYDNFTKDKAGIALRIINPIKKFRLGLNLIDTKKAKWFAQIKDRTQVKQELVKQPCYRVYFTHVDIELYETVKEYLGSGQSYYTPCLGLSEYLAQIGYVGEFSIKDETTCESTSIHSVIPITQKFPIHLGAGGENGRGEYFKEILPNDFATGNERIVQEFVKVLFERRGRAVVCVPPRYWKVENGENIIFL